MRFYAIWAIGVGLSVVWWLLKKWLARDTMSKLLNKPLVKKLPKGKFQ